MNTLIDGVAITALLGSAIIGGVFFAFSSFIMKALSKLPPSEGIAAMQSINVVVLNPTFLGAFFLTALLSLLMIVLVVVSRGYSGGYLLILAAVAYVVGCFCVTAFGNVPLNNQLADVTAADPKSVPVWSSYLDRWTVLNHIRTFFSLLAVLLYCLGLIL